MDAADSPPESESHLDEQLRKAARWAQRFSPGSRDRLPAVAADEQHGARWTGLAGAFEKYAVDASGIAGANSALGVLHALYGVEDAQAAMIATIDRNVRLLREGAFQSGQLLLREAGRVGTDDPEYAEFLHNARDHFYDARGLASSVQERAVVEFYLGTVYALEGRRSDAGYWLQQSHESATQVMVTLGSAAKNVKVLHSRTTTAALTFAYPAGMLVIPAKLKKLWTAERASTALEAFLPFVNCVVRSFNSLSAGNNLPAIELEKGSDGTYSLFVGGPQNSDD